MYRAEAFRDIGGFNPTVVAGEEPELCQRLRAKGWKVLRLPDEMTLHDSAMLRLGQWWGRGERGGSGEMAAGSRFKHPSFARQVTSARAWTVGWLIAVAFTWL